MKFKNDFTFSGLQITVLFIIASIFTIMLWWIIPLSTFLKILIFPFAIVLPFGAVGIFAVYFHTTTSIRQSWISVVITAFIFLTIPGSLCVNYHYQLKNYIASSPINGMISVKVLCDINSVHEHGNIGNEMKYYHYLDDIAFKNGDVISINVNKPFKITSEFVEFDGISDVGKTTSKPRKYTSGDSFDQEIVISQIVEVEEDGGRRNSGASATFKVTYRLNRVLDKNMGFWDIQFFNVNQFESPIVSLIIAGVVNIILILAIIVRGIRIQKQYEMAQCLMEERKRKLEESWRYQKKQEIENEKLKKHQQFLREKEAFIDSVQGRRLRDMTNVPENIRFVNGLPKDNNNSEYGSFTVYRSSNGKCYHEKRGCCSARRPIHYFDSQILQLKRCSKCCTQYREIPQWYKDYVFLVAQAKKYGIEIYDE